MFTSLWSRKYLNTLVNKTTYLLFIPADVRDFISTLPVRLAAVRPAVRCAGLREVRFFLGSPVCVREVASAHHRKIRCCHPSGFLFRFSAGRFPPRSSSGPGRCTEQHSLPSSGSAAIEFSRNRGPLVSCCASVLSHSLGFVLFPFFFSPFLSTPEEHVYC